MLEGTAQLVLTDLPYSIRRLNKSKNSAYDNLSFRDIRSTVELIADLLRPAGRETLFCTGQQFVVWHVLFSSQKSRQVEGSCSSSAWTSRDTTTISAAPVAFVDDASHHGNNPARQSRSLASSDKFALHVKYDGLLFAAEKATVNDKQLGFVGLAFPGYRDVTSGVRGPERSKRVTVAATKNGKEGSAGRLRPEKNSDSLLRELVSRFSRLRDWVVDLFPRKF